VPLQFDIWQRADLLLKEFGGGVIAVGADDASRRRDERSEVCAELRFVDLRSRKWGVDQQDEKNRNGDSTQHELFGLSRFQNWTSTVTRAFGPCHAGGVLEFAEVATRAATIKPL
jgi:hypothetical protein